MPSFQIIGYSPFAVNRRCGLSDDCLLPCARKRRALLDQFLEEELTSLLWDGTIPRKVCCQDVCTRHENQPQTSQCASKDTSEKAAVSNLPEKDFKAEFDTTGFRPEQISVKVRGRQLTVEAEHSESQDGRKVYRRMFQSMTVPEWLEPDTLKSNLSKEGLLTIEAPSRPAIKDIPIATSSDVSGTEDGDLSQCNDEKRDSNTES